MSGVNVGTPFDQQVAAFDRADSAMAMLRDELRDAKARTRRAEAAEQRAQEKLASERVRKQAVPARPKLERTRVEPVRRLALNKKDAAQALGVSVDFFDDHVASEVPCVYRGRRRLYRVADLDGWLERSGERTG